MTLIDQLLKWLDWFRAEVFPWIICFAYIFGGIHAIRNRKYHQFGRPSTWSSNPKPHGWFGQAAAVVLGVMGILIGGLVLVVRLGEELGIW